MFYADNGNKPVKMPNEVSQWTLKGKAKIMKWTGFVYPIVRCRTVFGVSGNGRVIMKNDIQLMTINIV